jgi:hypothetical protein
VKKVIEIVDTFRLFLSKEFLHIFVEETKRYTEYFGREFSCWGMEILRGGGEICGVGPLHAYGDHLEMYPKVLFYCREDYFHTSTKDIITGGNLKLCNCLHFLDNKGVGYQNFKIFHVISHLNNRFQELLFQAKDKSLTSE